MTVAAVIPARMSERLPGKPMICIAGVPRLQVAERFGSARA
jgi:CMP-2-keto-3-deoxyoctulosonic acid synthetase